MTVALVMAGLPARAEDVQSNIIEQLREQGFSKITVSRTLLGRGRIIAKSRNLTREIIFHPTTGAILRDYWTEQDGGEPRFGIVDLGRRSKDDDNQDASDDGDEGDDSGDDGDDSGDEGDSSGSGSGDDGDGEDGGDDGEGDDGGDSGEGDDGGDSGEGDDGGDD
ncbi:hypothetical protein ACXYMO_14805 [Arenibacterium sp. CAU 1754]